MSCERIVPTASLLEAGPPQSLLVNRAMVHGVVETPRRRALHQLRARLRPRRGVPGASTRPRRPTRRPGSGFRAEYLAGDEASYQQAVRRFRRRVQAGRQRAGMTAPAPTIRPRAEVCVVACAEAWRGDGEILASPMGLIPTLGARLAQLTFAPDLLLSDGEAYLPGASGDDERVIEGWLPYRSVFTMVAAGRAARDDGGRADRPVRQPEHLLHRRLGPAQGPAARRARRARQHHQPPDQLLGAPALAAASSSSGVDMVCGIGYDRAAGLGRAAPASTSCGCVVTNLAVLDFETPDHTHAAALGPPGRRGRATSPPRTGFPLAVPDEVPVTRLPDAGGAGPDPRPARPGRAARAGARRDPHRR